MPNNDIRDQVPARTNFAIGDHILVVNDAMDLLTNLQVLLESLLRMRPALAVLPIEGDKFIQMVALDDGGLRLESSASTVVLAANLGFSELVDGHEHIAGANIPADWKGREMMAAETLTRVVVDVHAMSFPAVLELRVFLRQ